MHDQLCDAISYFACSCGIGKICVHDKVLIENPYKEKGWRLDNFLMNVHLTERMDWNS